MAIDVAPAIKELDKTIRECTDATAMNLSYLQRSIKGINGPMNRLCEAAEEANKAAEKATKASNVLASRAHQLTVTSIWIAALALLVAGGHLAVSIIEIMN